jgi:hypothetical protein
MSVDFRKFFNLKNDYTKDELVSSYNNKLTEIDRMNISQVDKEYYKQNVKNSYLHANKYINRKDNKYINQKDNNNFDIVNYSNNLFNNFFNNFNFDTSIIPSKTSHFSQYQSSYSQVLNPDKSVTVIKNSITNNNGNINKSIKKYKKYQDGRIEWLNN